MYIAQVDQKKTSNYCISSSMHLGYVGSDFSWDCLQGVTFRCWKRHSLPMPMAFASSLILKPCDSWKPKLVGSVPSGFSTRNRLRNKLWNQGELQTWRCKSYIITYHNYMAIARQFLFLMIHSDACFLFPYTDSVSEIFLPKTSQNFNLQCHKNS